MTIGRFDITQKNSNRQTRTAWAGLILKVKLADSDKTEDVSTHNAKAVFFVKTFDGDVRHRALHFHENAPIVQGLWVRISFHDGEAIEGIISNSRDYVLEHGFFMMPTDPSATTQKSGIRFLSNSCR